MDHMGMYKARFENAGGSDETQARVTVKQVRNKITYSYITDRIELELNPIFDLTAAYFRPRFKRR